MCEILDMYQNNYDYLKSEQKRNFNNKLQFTC